MTRRPRNQPGEPLVRLATWLLATSVAVLVACTPAPIVAPPGEAPELPLRAPDGAERYTVTAHGTSVYARVFRGGRLEKLGHNHVVLFHEVRGDVFVGATAADSLFDLLITTASAEVDPPSLRQRQDGTFQTAVSDDARSRTRDNMLGPDQLDAAAHPYIKLSSTAINGSLARPRVTLDLSLRGVTRRTIVPVSVEISDDGRLVAEGELEVMQSDFGIEPFSTLGGALKVKDRVELVFTITAVRRGG